MSQKHRHRHRHRNRHHNNQGGGGGGQHQNHQNQGNPNQNPGNQNPHHQGGGHQGGGGGGGGGGGNRMRIIVDLDEALGTPITNGVSITGFQKRPGVDQLLERLSRRHNLLLWSAGSKRYVDKILTFGLRRYFREIYSADELPAMWKDPRKLKADYVIDVVQEHAKAAAAYGLSERFIIIPAYGDLEDERDPLAWTRQIEAILLPPLPPQQQGQQQQEQPPMEPMPEPVVVDAAPPAEVPQE